MREEANKCGIVSCILLSHYTQKSQESKEQAQSSNFLYEQKLDLANYIKLNKTGF